MSVHVDVTYKHNRSSAQPHYVSNEEVQHLAADVRRQIGCAGPDCLRATPRHLLGIEGMRANGVRLDICWTVDYPVTNERDEPVLGVCEYDHRGMPDTALISVNPQLTEGNESLLIGTLAHELGHAIFEVPGWRTSCRNDSLPGLFSEGATRVYRTVTPDEEHLSRKASKGDFAEWRSNEFMGSLIVPREHLEDRLRYHASRCGLPLESRRTKDLLSSFGFRSSPRIASNLEPSRFALPMGFVIVNLANEFGVSVKFIRVRLMRYGLATEEQLGVT